MGNNLNVFDSLVIDQDYKLCYLDESPLDLTKTEYELLDFLLTHRNRIHSREDILSTLWTKDVSPRTVDTNVTRLRRKIGRYGDHIITRRGFGYGFREEL